MKDHLRIVHSGEPPQKRRRISLDTQIKIETIVFVALGIAYNALLFYIAYRVIGAWWRAS